MSSSCSEAAAPDTPSPARAVETTEARLAVVSRHWASRSPACIVSSPRTLAVPPTSSQGPRAESSWIRVARAKHGGSGP